VLKIETYKTELAALGLGTIEGIKRFEGCFVDQHPGRSDTAEITIERPGGQPLTLFLKRNWQVRKRNALWSPLRRGSVWSAARIEWENMRALEAAGIPTARLVGFAEECSGLSERFSSIITESAGEMSIVQFIAECRDRERRAQVFSGLARLVRRMHDTGFASADLFARHIFVEGAAEKPVFKLIDMARLDRRAALSRRLRARDLCSLNASAPVRHVSAKERIRFLRAYAGEVDRDLVRRIERRMRRLLKRPKFRGFGARE